MKNLDKIREQKTVLTNALAEAARSGDEQQISAAMDNWMQFVSDTVMDEAKGISAVVDRNVLAARGVRQLTSQETEFYENFIKSARAEDSQTVITNIDRALPQTVIDSVMDDMVQAHPLLGVIDFVNTGAAIKWVLNAQGAQAATWDALNTAITKNLAGAIQVIDLTQKKLSAYMFATQDMLALGPVWVDRYVRAVLADALAAGLEVGIVDGTGVNDPIGMTRAFTSAFDPSDGYARKQAITVGSFSAKEYGSLLAQLAVDGYTGKPRDVGEVLLIVNPADYYGKVMPATTIRVADGSYVSGVFPVPTRVIKSAAVPADHAVLGIAKKYFMGAGTGKGGKLEASDDYKFLEDLRTYKIKFYGTGRPYDINSFLYLDIENLEADYPTINTLVPENP